MIREMWEILVPADPPYKGAHEEWDAKVVAISGGLTILHPTLGKWGATRERMVPVRIACLRAEMAKIQKMTKEHYKQDAVMFWLVSNEVYIE